MTRTICPVCNGKGRIPNPKSLGGEVPFCREITCPNCQGEGFIGIPDNLTKPQKYISKK